MGKNIPISDFNPDLNFDNKLIKIEHWSWKIAITDNALFFNNDKQRYCLIALRNLHHVNKILTKLITIKGHENILIPNHKD